MDLLHLFFLPQKKKKEWLCIVVQTRKISQLNSSYFWVMEEQWHKPLSVGYCLLCTSAGNPAAQLAPASKTKSSQHHYGLCHPQLHATWESKETNISCVGIGQFPCYINPEYINMITKPSCMKPQWVLYNLCPYFYHKKKVSFFFFFLNSYVEEAKPKRINLKHQRSVTMKENNLLFV